MRSPPPSHLPGSALKPGAMIVISHGMKISPSSTKTRSTVNSTAKASSAKARTAGDGYGAGEDDERRVEHGDQRGDPEREA